MLLMLASANASAQIKYSGKHFFFSLGGYVSAPYDGPYIDSSTADYQVCYLQFASAHHATINLHYTNSGSTNTYTLTPYTPFTDSLTEGQIFEIVDFQAEVVHNKTMEITSDSDITVSFVGGSGNLSDDAMSILPCDSQRSADLFYLLGITGYFSTPYTYSIVSNSDSVVLRITPKANTITHPAGIPYTITMNKGDDYRIANSCFEFDSTLAWDNDISGTKVEVLSAPVCMPIDIYVTYTLLELSYPLGDSTVSAADILLEEIMPAAWWDTLYPVIPYLNDSMTIVRVLSSANSNNIYYNGVLARTLNTGQFFDTVITTGQTAIIRGAYPIGVSQFMTREYAADMFLPNGDPDMLWCNSQRQGIKDAVYTPFFRMLYLYPGDVANYTLTMISKTSNIGSITVNGVSVGSSFSPFASDPSWSYAYIPNDMGVTYRVQSAQPIIAYQVEQEAYGSYSYNLSDLGITPPELTQTDTVLGCKGMSTVLTTTLTPPYTWSTGDTTHSITVSGGNNYSITGSYFDGCAETYLTQIFYIIYRTDTFYKRDTVYKCSNIHTVLTSDSGAHYLWSTGDTTRSISVIDSGHYSVTSTLLDTCMLVTMHDFYVINHTDTLIRTDTIRKCSNIVMTLTADSSDHYQWSTGDSTRSISVTAAGSYSVTGVITDTCIVVTKQHFYVINHNDTLILSDEINKCANSTVTLPGDAADHYQWSTGDTTSSITVIDAGSYTVHEVLTDTCVTYTTHTYAITNYSYPPIVLSDTSFCVGDSITLNANYADAVWNTGAAGPVIVVGTGGVYKVQALDSCGVLQTDSVTITEKACSERYCTIEFPSAFTPNEDSKNDIFRAVSHGEFDNYDLQIFNRFGQCVFMTNDVTKGWDGAYNNAKADVGTYYYLCTFTCPLKGKLQFKGDVTLIR